jgi:hypothetical protein
MTSARLATTNAAETGTKYQEFRQGVFTKVNNRRSNPNSMV